jgi:hypothetical protein
VEGLARTSTDINRTTHGSTRDYPIPGTVGATITKDVFAVNCVFNSVCAWNLIMMSSFDAIPNQCYVIGSEVPNTTVAANAAAWIKLTPQPYKITYVNF